MFTIFDEKCFRDCNNIASDLFISEKTFSLSKDVLLFDNGFDVGDVGDDYCCNVDDIVDFIGDDNCLLLLPFQHLHE